MITKRLGYVTRNRYRGASSWYAHMNHSLVAGLRIVFHTCKTLEEKRAIIGLSETLYSNRELLLDNSG